MSISSSLIFIYDAIVAQKLLPPGFDPQIAKCGIMKWWESSFYSVILESAAYLSFCFKGSRFLDLTCFSFSETDRIVFLFLWMQLRPSWSFCDDSWPRPFVTTIFLTSNSPAPDLVNPEDEKKNLKFLSLGLTEQTQLLSACTISISWSKVFRRAGLKLVPLLIMILATTAVWKYS